MRAALCGGVFALASAAAAFGQVAPPPTLAVARFDFSDTSGEARDQAAEHAARLELFDAALRDELAVDGIDPVPLSCAGSCLDALPGLAAQAREAGVRYVVVGRVSKVSTLVGSVAVAVLDVEDGRATCERRLSYRGDSDEAWLRAADFVAGDILRYCIP